MRKTLFVLGCLFALLLLLLLFADYQWGTNPWLGDYIRGTATSVIGTILTVFIVERLLSREDEREEKREAMAQIDRLDVLLRMYILNYHKYAYLMTCSYEDQCKEISFVQQNFDFKRLTNVFNLSLHMQDGIGSRAYKLFFENLERLLNVMRDSMLNIDFKYFPELSQFMIQFIKKSEAMNCHKAVDGDYQSFLSSGPVTDKWLPVQLIKDYEGPLEYKPHNTINIYILLYQMINFQIGEFDKYFKLIQDFDDRMSRVPKKG
ncbi:MAG: hypothetical protein PHI23_00705 [Candidatus Peribacteraceae bacterium]|nr:hypothetical protein [Candidatus Peribacteraceae bacterium]